MSVSSRASRGSMDRGSPPNASNIQVPNTSDSDEELEGDDKVLQPYNDRKSRTSIVSLRLKQQQKLHEDQLNHPSSVSSSSQPRRSTKQGSMSQPRRSTEHGSVSSPRHSNEQGSISSPRRSTEQGSISHMAPPRRSTEHDNFVEPAAGEIPDGSSSSNITTLNNEDNDEVEYDEDKQKTDLTETDIKSILDSVFNLDVDDRDVNSDGMSPSPSNSVKVPNFVEKLEKKKFENDGEIDDDEYVVFLHRLGSPTDDYGSQGQGRTSYSSKPGTGSKASLDRKDNSSNGSGGSGKSNHSPAFTLRLSQLDPDGNKSAQDPTGERTNLRSSSNASTARSQLDKGDRGFFCEGLGSTLGKSINLVEAYSKSCKRFHGVLPGQSLCGCDELSCCEQMIYDTPHPSYCCSTPCCSSYGWINQQTSDGGSEVLQRQASCAVARWRAKAGAELESMAPGAMVRVTDGEAMARALKDGSTTDAKAPGYSNGSLTAGTTGRNSTLGATGRASMGGVGATGPAAMGGVGTAGRASMGGVGTTGRDSMEGLAGAAATGRASVAAAPEASVQLPSDPADVKVWTADADGPSGSVYSGTGPGKAEYRPSMTPHEAAVTIQRMYRGFKVRKQYGRNSSSNNDRSKIYVREMPLPSPPSSAAGRPRRNSMVKDPALSVFRASLAEPVVDWETSRPRKQRARDADSKPKTSQTDFSESGKRSEGSYNSQGRSAQSLQATQRPRSQIVESSRALVPIKEEEKKASSETVMMKLSKAKNTEKLRESLARHRTEIMKHQVFSGL